MYGMYERSIPEPTPRKGPIEQLDIELQLRGKLATSLIAQARRHKRKPVELLADLIEAILEDDIVAAILDERP